MKAIMFVIAGICLIPFVAYAEAEGEPKSSEHLLEPSNFLDAQLGKAYEFRVRTESTLTLLINATFLNRTASIEIYLDGRRVRIHDDRRREGFPGSGVFTERHELGLVQPGLHQFTIQSGRIRSIHSIALSATPVNEHWALQGHFADQLDTLKQIDGGITQVGSGISQLQEEFRNSRTETTSLKDLQRQSAGQLTDIGRTMRRISLQMENDPSRSLQKQSASDLADIAKTLRRIEVRPPVIHNSIPPKEDQSAQILDRLDHLAAYNQPTLTPSLPLAVPPLPTSRLNVQTTKKCPKLQTSKRRFPYWIPITAGVGGAAMVGTGWALHEHGEAHQMAEWERAEATP